jgi:hypothetical protein
MLQFAHTILTYVTAHWPAIVSLFGGGAGLSVILQYVLHKLDIDSKKLAYSLIHLLSFGAAVSAYYLDNVSALSAYAGLVIAAQTVHRFVVSPYYTKYVLPYLTFLSESSATAAPGLPSQAGNPAAEAPAFVS